MRTTKAFLTTKVEALHCENIVLSTQLEALRAENALLRQQLQPLAASQLIANRGALLKHLRRLTQEGVPCHAVGDYIRHRVTGAVIAQVQKP